MVVDWPARKWRQHGGLFRDLILAKLIWVSKDGIRRRDVKRVVNPGDAKRRIKLRKQIMALVDSPVTVGIA